MACKPGSKQQILDLFLRNVGTVLESREIQAACGGAVEWARRLRELRNEDGYHILSHKDRADLRPNQYLMETTVRTPVLKRSISAKTRAEVIERNGYTCQMWCRFWRTRRSEPWSDGTFAHWSYRGPKPRWLG